MAYKIRKDLESNDFIIVDYAGLCAAKGLKPISKPKKRTIRNLASVYRFPVLSGVAIKAMFTAPLDEFASSKALTAAYVKEFLESNYLKA